jgi:hypothetical protein
LICDYFNNQYMYFLSFQLHISQDAAAGRGNDPCSWQTQVCIILSYVVIMILSTCMSGLYLFILNMLSRWNSLLLNYITRTKMMNVEGTNIINYTNSPWKCITLTFVSCKYFWLAFSNYYYSPNKHLTVELDAIESMQISSKQKLHL